MPHLACMEASEQRKEEHEEFTELMASDSAAKEILKFAINRLNKRLGSKINRAARMPPTSPSVRRTPPPGEKQLHKMMQH